MSEAGGQMSGFKPLPLDVDTIKLKDHEPRTKNNE